MTANGVQRINLKASLPSLRNDNWKQIAKYTLLRAVPRRGRKETSISDTGFCHGSVGVAYLFPRYANRYQASVLAQASQYWLKETVNSSLPESEKDIFRPYAHIGGSDLHRPNLGLLEGESGMGLMLLTHLGASLHAVIKAAISSKDKITTYVISLPFDKMACHKHKKKSSC